MRQRRVMRSLLLTTVAVAAAVTMLWSSGMAQSDDPRSDGAAGLNRPSWAVGDSWIIETSTNTIQDRMTKPGTNLLIRIRWQFSVAILEEVGGHECYRVDIQCLAEGRLRPKATIWCDSKTFFLRQFQTQYAFGGKYHLIQESYDCPEGALAAVVPPVNVIPLGMPAFLPKGAKGDTFSYTSQPLPAGAKDPSIIRFTHMVRQQVGPPEAKSLEMVPRAFSKSLDNRPIKQVKLSDHDQSVTQLWREGSPWPVYVDNGRTKAWLVSAKTRQ